MNEPEITTPLTKTFQRLKELAVETGLLHAMDIVALEKLAELNQVQQQADRLDEYAPEQRALIWPFKQRYTWLHVINQYFIHRDDQTRVWRLGTELGRRRGGC